MKNSILLDYTNEVKRKKIHLLSIFIPIFYILFPTNIIPFIVTLTFIVLVVDISRLYFNTKLNIFYFTYLSNTTRQYESNNLLSATYLILVSFFIILFFNKDIAIISISIVSIADAMAAIFGIKYGKIKLLNNKTLEGSLIFLLFSLIITFLSIYILLVQIDIIILFICAIMATIIEHISTTKFDNITVPLFSAIFLGLAI